MSFEDQTSATTPVRRPRTRVARPGKVVLNVLDGPRSGVHEVERAEVKAGRSSFADIQLGHTSISKLHFSLTLTNEGVMLRDLDSRNGTWVASRRVDGIVLYPGDEFMAGECRIRLEAVGDVEVEALDGDRFGRLRGSSLAMRELYAQIEALGPTPLDLLILGETGTGKELTARTIHELSKRRGPFVILDCAALSNTLADGTLFGFRKGAFTGADRDQAGIFEAADGGTLFVDEVGELTREHQRKLLGVLERRQVERLGEPNNPRAIDVRIVAATHRDLREAVADGTFREDLYYRLARGIVRTPPLRARGDDVLALATFFVKRLSKEYGVSVSLGQDAVMALFRHRWPGNVRELRNVVERAAHVRGNGVIASTDLMLGESPQVPDAKSIVGSLTEKKTYEEVHADLDKIFLAWLGDHYNGNLSHMASHLEISRDRLRRLLKKVDLYDSPK